MATTSQDSPNLNLLLPKLGMVTDSAKMHVWLLLLAFSL